MVAEPPGPGWEQGLDGKWHRVGEPATPPQAAPRHVIEYASAPPLPSTGTPRATPRSAASRGLLIGIVLLVIAAGTAIGVVVAKSSSTSTRGRESPTTAPLDLHQPALADLELLAPGAVDGSAAVSAATQAPLLCGGTSPSRLTGSTVVSQPGSLAGISVLRFAFATRDAARAYAQSVFPQAAYRSGCSVPVANSGTFKPVSFIPTAHGIYSASAATSFSSGPYAHSYLWSTMSYVPQGTAVYIVRIDTINGYADLNLEDAVLNSMEAPGGPKLESGSHSVQHTTVRAVLQHSPYSGAAESQGLVPQGGPAGAAYFDCPEVVVGTTVYNLTLEHQLVNAQAVGLVVLTPNGSTETIPWGAPVSLVVDLFATAADETEAPCGSSPVNSNPNFANVLSLTSGT